MSLIRKHGAVLQAWACLDLVKPVVLNKHSTGTVPAFNLYSTVCHM